MKLLLQVSNGLSKHLNKKTHDALGCCEVGSESGEFFYADIKHGCSLFLLARCHSQQEVSKSSQRLTKYLRGKGTWVGWRGFTLCRCSPEPSPCTLWPSAGFVLYRFSHKPFHHAFHNPSIPFPPPHKQNCISSTDPSCP